MKDDYLGSYIITYIEKEITQTFDDDSIIDEFCDMKERRLQFKMLNLSKLVNDISILFFLVHVNLYIQKLHFHNGYFFSDDRK